MTDSGFVPTKPHRRGEFAFLSSPRRRYDLGLGVLTAPRALTLGPRLRERENHSANSWRNASNLGPCVRRAVSLRTLTGGRHTSLAFSNADVCGFRKAQVLSGIACLQLVDASLLTSFRYL
ncbi:hypothetical protein Noc_3005 [Nitrosococcus oceani ATCC 19707]|uniref:Uncharacterized protein n=1 Tax=Nitrosococcus oceani (strain ATCC 19707 / BCRC 17464 / JCM 30415 / NCIMB 11848 / C-107) TaxID=323261 RepID=Q3J6U9_NITOC|nr:hypothetical protein Noc_3005 [Nitrosococcus oceani ATCC 19707]